MNVRTSTTRPLYDELAHILRERILTGTYPPGSKIPSESQLMEDTGLSRSTVRHALDVLVDEGLLTKKQGQGAFVPDTPAIDTASPAFTSFTAEMEKRGNAVTTRTVDAGPAAAPHAVASFLGTDDQGTLIKIMRLRYVDGEPFSLESTYLPASFSDIVEMDLSRSLHAILREAYRREPARGHKTFEVCLATQNEAFLLDVEKGAPLMLVSDYVCNADAQPLYVSKRVMRTDRAKYIEPIG